jgi:hypothetical protein
MKEIFAAFVVHFRYLRKVYEQQQEVARVAQEQIAQAAAGHPLQQPRDPLAEMRTAHRRKERKAQVCACKSPVRASSLFELSSYTIVAFKLRALTPLLILQRWVS